MLSRQTAAAVREDFDRLADLTAEGWDGNAQYHRYLSKSIPARCEKALDIGCGTGAFSRLLARRSGEVLALDLSPNMIRVARERSQGFSNITYRVQDVTKWEFPNAAFDCVASIATLHHLPAEETLARMANAVRPGGTLLILDLFAPRGLPDHIQWGLAAAVSPPLRFIKTGRVRMPREVREAWESHGRTDSYPVIAEVRSLSDRLLPGARVRRHLLWRYSLVWSKPDRDP